MCRGRNGTIFAPCREYVRREAGRAIVSDQEARRILNRNGGCAIPPENRRQGRYVVVQSPGDRTGGIDNREERVL